MAECNIVMPSYTYAVKAERILRSHGIACEIRRKTLPDEGCGYSLYLTKDCGLAINILKKNKLPLTNITGGG